MLQAVGEEGTNAFNPPNSPVLCEVRRAVCLPWERALPLAQAALAQEPEAGLALQKLVSLRAERGVGLKMCILSSCQFVQKQCHLLPALPHLLFSPSLPRRFWSRAGIGRKRSLH